MLQALLASTGLLAIAASIAATFDKLPDGAGGDDAPRGRRRRRGACAGQRISCARSRTAPRSADVVSAA
jgi:hypothetical protein